MPTQIMLELRNITSLQTDKCDFTKKYNVEFRSDRVLLHILLYNVPYRLKAVIYRALPLTTLSCWPALWDWLGFWWACPGLWQSVQTLACRCVPSPSSPTWAGAAPQDSPSEREDGSPRLLLWSPAGERGSNLKKGIKMSREVDFRGSELSRRLRGKFETHILVGHLPVGSLSIWNHLPHDDTVTPHIAGWGELPVGYGLWSRPPDGDLASLEMINETTRQHVALNLTFHPVCNGADT